MNASRSPYSACIGGVYIAQPEKGEWIPKALETFILWYPNINPKYRMIDFSQVEINAIKFFHNSWIALCIFFLHSKPGSDSVEEMRTYPARVTHWVCCAIWQMPRQWPNSPRLSRQCRPLTFGPAILKFRGYTGSHWLPAKKMWATNLRLWLPKNTNNGNETKMKT